MAGSAPAPLPFVGREAETAFLRDRLAVAAEGTCSIVLVGAEPGGGKTRLATEVAATLAAHDGHDVWARCVHAEGAPQLWPWTQALRQVRAIRPDADVDPVLGVVLPEIGGPTAAACLGPASRRFELFAAMADLLTAPGGPRLIVVDDAQWADQASLVFLGFLAEALVGSTAGVVLLVLYRDTEGAGTPFADTLAGLTRQPISTRFDLRGLDTEAVAACVSAVTATPTTPAAAEELARRTGGNPFFVAEVARLLPSGPVGAQAVGAALWRVPPQIRAVLDQRLSRLGEQARDVLAAAAVIRRDVDAHVLARMTGRPVAAVAQALADAVDHRLLTAVPAVGRGRYAFAHALVQESLYEGLDPERRARLHAAAAAALQALEGASLASVSHHLREAAGDGDRETLELALAATREAADLAAARLAYEDAVEDRRAALAVARRLGLPPERLCDLHLELGHALNRAGDVDSAQRAFLDAAAAARASGRLERLADAALGYRHGIATGFEFAAPEPELTAMLREALTALPSDDDARRAALLARLGMELYFTAPEAERRGLSDEAVAAARRAGDPLLVAEALLARHIALWSPDNVAVQLAAADEAVAIARQLRDLELEVQARYWRVTDLLELGEFARVDDDVAAVERLAERLRQPLYRWWAEMRRAMRALLDGRFDEAERLAVAAFDTGFPVKPANAWQSLSAQLLLLRSEQGRLAELDGPVEENLGRHPGSPVWRCARAFVDAALERPSAADLLPELVAHHRDAPRDFLWMVSMAQLVAVAVEVDDAGSARVLHELLMPYDGQWVSVGPALICYGPVARLLGLAAAVAGEVEDADRHLDEAHRAARAARSAPWSAHALHDRAFAHARAVGELDTTARRLATECLESAEQLGMTALAARAERLLGGRRPDDTLTRREREVLRLAREGLTAADIARALVISERTAETHLANIYRKLGVRRRSELLAQR